MVRTKADSSSVRVCAAKAPRKVVSSGGGSSGASPCRSGSSKDKYSGGNSYNPQPIPNWQKGISSFFKPGLSKSDASQEKEIEKVSKDQIPEIGGTTPRKSGEPSTSLAQNGIISDDDDA